MQEHYSSEQHQRSLVRCAQQIVESTNGDSSRADIDMEDENTSLLENYEKLSMITQKIEINQDEIARLGAVSLQYYTQTVTLPQELNSIQNAFSIEKAHIDAMSFNQNVLVQGITTVKQQIESKNETVTQEPDGTMVWRITNVREKMYDAQSERQTSIYSHPFYTSICGYKLCIRLYLNGDGSARGSHISIFLVILRGQYDSLLKWPFSYRVSFCLCDQRTIIGTTQPKHIIESFRPDINSISFQRPCSAMNIASGISKFTSLDEINRPENENLYVVNDTIFIKTLIDFIGVSRSMLAFIFNLNIALPVNIQQKLIAEEIRRRQEQNIN